MQQPDMGVPSSANADAETQGMIFWKTKVVRRASIHEGETAGRRRVPGMCRDHIQSGLQLCRVRHLGANNLLHLGRSCRAADVSAMAVRKVACEGGQVIAASSMSRMFSIVKGWAHRRLLLVFLDSSAASCADRTALE